MNFLKREVKGELGLKRKRKLSELNEKYRVKRMIENCDCGTEAKDVVISAKVIRYQQRIEKLRQNRIFDFDQEKMYAEFSGDRVRSTDQVMYQMLKELKDLGAIFEASGKGIIEKQIG